MSNYTAIVNYAPKDALTTGDPAKRIKGVELAAEFTSIGSMSVTKEDTTNKGVANGYAPLNGSILLADTYLTTNIPRLAQTATISAAWTFSTGSIHSNAASATANGWSINVNNSNPGILFYNTGSAVDEKVWEIRTTGSTFFISSWSDAYGSQLSPFVITRSGATTAAITLTAPTIHISGELNLGNSTDTTFSRLAPGRAAIEGIEIGYRQLPSGSVTTGAFAASDQGKGIYATAGVTIPNSTMAANDVVVIQNTTGSGITITRSITTAYNTAGGATLGATFTLGARGRCAIVFTSATECYVSGNI